MFSCEVRNEKSVRMRPYGDVLFAHTHRLAHGRYHCLDAKSWRKIKTAWLLDVQDCEENENSGRLLQVEQYSPATIFPEPV